MKDELVRPLPVVVNGIQDESGLSYAYRALFANGLSFKEAQHWLKLKSWTSLGSRDLTVLAWALGVDRFWLSFRTFSAFREHPPRRFGFMSHAFGEGAANFSRSARLCPSCVKRHKYARATWQFRGVCGCVEHNTALLERCPSCLQLICWNRPAIDICTCGHFLTSASEKVHLPSHVANWIRWIEARLAEAEATTPVTEFGLPSLLNALTVDGAFRLVLAVGLTSTPNETLTSATARVRSSAGMSTAISLGLDRLSTLDCEFKELHALNSVIHFPALERMRSNAVAPGDANCAGLMIDQLRRGLRSESNKQGVHPRGQLRLFS